MIRGKVIGDFTALERLGTRIGKSTSKTALTGLARAIGNEVVFQVHVGFSQHTDPYGQPWAPKRIPDGKPPLSGKTGRLRAGWYLKFVGPDRVVVGNRRDYAKFQNGTGVFGPTGQPITPKSGKALSFKVGGRRFAFKSVRGAPPRLMVPRTDDVPFTWNRAITAAAREYMRARFKGR